MGLDEPQTLFFQITRYFVGNTILFFINQTDSSLFGLDQYWKVSFPKSEGYDWTLSDPKEIRLSRMEDDGFMMRTGLDELADPFSGLGALINGVVEGNAKLITTEDLIPIKALDLAQGW